MEIFSKSLAALVVNKRLIIRAATTLLVLAVLVYIIRLLFTYSSDTGFRENMLNVIIGAVIMSFSKVMDFWFRRDDEDKVDSSVNDIK